MLDFCDQIVPVSGVGCDTEIVNVFVTRHSARPPLSGVFSTWYWFEGSDASGAKLEFYIQYLEEVPELPVAGSQCDVTFTRRVATGSTMFGRVDERDLVNVVTGYDCSISYSWSASIR